MKSYERLNDIDIYRFSYTKIKYFGLISVWLSFLQYSWLIFNQDIIHVHDVFIWFLPYRIIFFWKRVYTTFHGWEGIYPIANTSILQRKIAASLSTNYICVGEYISKYYDIAALNITYGGVNYIDTKFGNKVTNKIVYLGRLSIDTGLEILLKYLKTSKKRDIVFCGDGELRNKCLKYGNVINNPILASQILASSDICIASGYLSALEALSNQCYTLVIATNEVRVSAFRLSPFNSWIRLCNTPEGINMQLDEYAQSRKSYKKQLIMPAWKWAAEQTWSKVSKLYVNLWN